MEVQSRCTCSDFKPVSATITFHSLGELEAFYALTGVSFECVESNNEGLEIDYDSFTSMRDSLFKWASEKTCKFL